MLKRSPTCKFWAAVLILQHVTFLSLRTPFTFCGRFLPADIYHIDGWSYWSVLFFFKELLILLMFLSQLEPLAYRRMDFEEFCAAAISPYQLEALERWEEIAGTAFQHFEQEGNRVISVEELAQVFSTYAYPLGYNIFSTCTLDPWEDHCLFFLSPSYI